MRMIIVLTGTPGVGKTSVSKLLASQLHARYIDLSELALRDRLLLGWDDNRKTAVADVERLSTRLAEIAASSEESFVVDGHYASDVVPSDVVSFVFVLRRDPWMLKKELESRGYGSEKVRENVAAEILDICLSEAVAAFGEQRVSEIDVTDLSPEETVDKLLSIIRTGRALGVGLVDWLSRPGIEELLEKSTW